MKQKKTKNVLKICYRWPFIWVVIYKDEKLAWKLVFIYNSFNIMRFYLIINLTLNSKTWVSNRIFNYVFLVNIVVCVYCVFYFLSAYY